MGDEVVITELKEGLDEYQIDWYRKKDCKASIVLSGAKMAEQLTLQMAAVRKIKVAGKVSVLEFQGLDVSWTWTRYFAVKAYL